MKKLQRLAISCGGTGGHFLPGLAIARTFKEAGGEPLLLIGGKHVKEQMKMTSGFGIQACEITAVPLAKSPVRLCRSLYGNWQGFRRSCQIFRDFHPQAYLSMGSFASLPPALAAVHQKIPMFLHDGNALLGKMNIFMSRWAEAFALSFPSINENAAKCPLVQTGLPLRPELLTAKRSKEEAVRELNQLFSTDFTPENPVILVFGGSLGARTLNESFFVDPAMPGAEEIQIIQLTGKNEEAFQAVQNKWQKFPGKTLTLTSCNQMDLLYQTADLVVSRAGGSTVAELAYFGKYAVLIPFPFAAEHHQDDNSRWLLQNGGGLMLQDAECSRERFQTILADWYPHWQEYREKGLLSQSLAQPQASENVLNLIESTVFSGGCKS